MEHEYQNALARLTSFSERVYDVVRKIPKGETRTYAEVAKLAGRPKAFRAVGNILNKNRDKRVPCHRVVRSDGSVGGFAWGTPKKTKILKKEGALKH
jgi:AraC family transcriptional regulator of adaptative response/methylated-DNA-[protein]-cysteine methyltransferase